jgi:hypothetical protein
MHSRGFQMIDRTILRLMIGVGVPIASAVVLEQLPKTGVAEVPFAFQVAEQTLPRGTYAVRQADNGRDVRIWNEKVAGVGMSCAALKRKFGKAQGARLVFENHAGRYFLSEIWFDTDGRGLILAGRGKEGAATKSDDPEIRNILFQ